MLRIRSLYSDLYLAFGPQHWWPAESPLEVIVGAVLTQNTAWTNVEKAMTALKHRQLLSLHRLVELRPEELAPVIRSAGFHNTKARRLLSLLEWIDSEGGVSALENTPTTRLRKQLVALPGIGLETADSILLYALGRPVFVIDTYTRRILCRHGLTGGSETYDELQAVFHASLPRRAALFNEYHALLVRLAKFCCRASPDCSVCPLA